MLTATYTRRNRPQLMGDLGIDIPGASSVASVGKGIYYIGIGTALIVGSLFVWKLVDTFFGD